MKNATVCVIGSINVDLTFRTHRLPKPGETLAGLAFHLGMGGKGANQAVVASRLGAQVTLVARVGADPFGQEAIRCFQKDGIDTSFVREDAERPTGAAAIIVDDHAENCILVVAGANERIVSDDVRAAASAVQESDVVLCQLEIPIEATLEAFRLARAAGVRTMLTPAPAAELPNELLHLCDVCVPNQTELEVITGRTIESLGDAESAAVELRARGVGTVAVTMGRQGALLLDSMKAIHVPAVDVHAIDTTGAGDAFTAALAVFLAQGQSLHEAAEHASVVAALTVTRIGTQSAFPTLSEIDAWMMTRQSRTP